MALGAPRHSEEQTKAAQAASSEAMWAGQTEMPGAISRSAHHQPLHQQGGRLQAQPAPGCIPSKARKTHVLNDSRAPSAGAGSNGRAPSPRCSRAGCLGVGQRGVPHPGTPSTALASRCPFPLGAWDGLVPRRSPPPQMRCRSQESSGACWEHASTGLFCISN